MTNLRTAAQQALEALEEYQSKGAPFLACDGAIDTLRAAMAQQADKPQRPKCLEFALDFLGTPENGELLAYIEQLEVQRDALLEVLRYIGEYRGEGPNTIPWRNIVADLGKKARAAIKAVEGDKA